MGQDQRLYRIGGHRLCVAKRHVDCRRNHRSRPVEIDVEPVTRDRYLASQRNSLAECLDLDRVAIDPVGKRRDALAHRHFRLLNDCICQRH